MNQSVLVGLSGGVDSAVSAYLLQQQGFSVHAGTLKMTDTKDGIFSEADDAKAVADTLNITHAVIDCVDEFRKTVQTYFVDSYLHGETPNPCVFCNKAMKFPALIRYADRNGIDLIATGHYARLEKHNGRTLLRRSADLKKDQTYMLYALPQSILSRVCFPLEGLTKAEIRQIALDHHLPVASKKDSQDICFIKDGDYARFITEFTGQESRTGPFTDKDGHVLGTHKGIIAYTVGQRKGLGLSSEKPLYVVKKDAESGVVMLGHDTDLWAKRVLVKHTNFIPFDRLSSDISASAKLRYSQQDSPCKVHPTENGMILEFDTPQRAVTPGQSAVLYDGDTVLGGGEIVGTLA